MKRGYVPIIHEVEISTCKQSPSKLECGATAYRSSQSSSGEKGEANLCKQTPPEYSDAEYRSSQSSGEKMEVNICKKQSLRGLECGAAACRLSHSSGEE